MPTYEYQCNLCDHQFEAVQSFSEPAIEICPLCKGAVRKLYNNVGVVFKGSGFYKTDSRASSAPASPTATKSDTTVKSESKVEKASPPKSEA
jgi:putative FmdB family regulatory protein